MASTLFETLQNQLNKQPAAPAPTTPALGQTQSLRDLLAAKSGKAVGAGAAPAQSNIQEQAAADQTRSAFGQLNQQYQQQQEQNQLQQLGAQQQAEQEQTAFGQKQQQQKQEARLRTNQILGELEQSNKQLDNQDYISKLEQVGFGMRLGNEQYVQSLQDAGAKARLDNDYNFKVQAAADAFQGQIGLMKDQSKFKQMIDMNDREFTKWLSDMDINEAVRIANDASRAANQQAIYTGIGNLAQAGIGAAQQYYANKAEE